MSSPPSPPGLIVISGPTAVGKTSLAIEVAKQLHTVILSADSRQCYRELNIAVARPTEQELQAVPHYFIASHSITDDLNAAAYEKYALDLLQQLFTKYDQVVVTGGTGLYIKALLEGLDEIPEVPAAIRRQITEDYQSKGITWLQQELQQKDPEFAAKGEMQNPQRMMRALEVMEAIGRSLFSFRNTTKPARNFSVLHISLTLPRNLLYPAINERVEKMMEAGLEAEARQLFPYRHLNALQTVGYREMFDYFDHRSTLQEAVALIQQNTRHYAKRQETWFKKQPAIHFFSTTDPAAIITFIRQHLAMT